jgi:hypothetical protein
VATAPFEVLMGTVRANDLFLAGAVVAGLVVLVYLDRRPVLQGALLAVFFWFGTYVKVWAFYFLPALAVYYASRFVRESAWRSVSSFAAVSLLLHGGTGLFWKQTIGVYFPFLFYYPPTGLIPGDALGAAFGRYPGMLLGGSEFGTTLFGVIPYLLVVLLTGKVAATWGPGRSGTGLAGLRFDRADAALCLMYGSFFVLLNFLPNRLALDGYYSVQRIFRYLTPLSFPMALHVAKMLCGVLKPGAAPSWTFAALRSGLLVGLICLNLLQAHVATRPGREYRRAFQGMLASVDARRPPALLAESWMGSFLRSVYLRPSDVHVVTPSARVNSARDHEAWLEQHQANLPAGAMLITGLGSYVHYGPHMEGFKLRHFSRPLHPHWELVGDYGLLTYLPLPEHARLWRLSAPITESAIDARDGLVDDAHSTEPGALHDLGMRAFDGQDYPRARRYFEAVIQRTRGPALDARYFRAVTFFREGNWRATIREFEHLLTIQPGHRWTAAAHWHIARALQELGDEPGARWHFQQVIERFPTDTHLVALSREGLRSMTKAEGRVPRWWRLLRAP